MRHVLLVHPDKKLVEIYHKRLSPHFSVDSAHDGLAGLRQIKLHRPRVIVSDLELPYMSGLALLDFVRNHPELYATPFLFLTQSPMPPDALGLGATAWLNQREHGPDSLLEQLALHRHALRA